ncbi:MAG: hypothetical protein WDW38_008420 [Sanguina aurantia]
MPAGLLQAHTSGSGSGSSNVLPRIVVFGGRGFVGSHVCQEALNTGLHVVGVSRSGTPPLTKESWVDQVEWVRGNALEPQTYQHQLEGAVAAISCIGTFGSQDEMYKLNGTANVTAVEQCAAAGVPRFVFLSAQIPQVPGIDTLLSGYVKGKAAAEEAVRTYYPRGGVILRPGVVYGERVVSNSLSLPLQYVFGPLEWALSFVPSKALSGAPLLGTLFVPPLNVDAVARAAVRAAIDGSVAAGVAVAAGPGVGVCNSDGSLVPVFDNRTRPATNFVVLGIQCVNKGLVHCRENAEDTQDCLIVIELPVQPLAAPCGLSEGGRYMFMLKAKPNACGGVYQSYYAAVEETIRPPLGGTGCTYYPTFAPVNEMYTWRTSGLPVNCYGRNYITNRITAIQAANATAAASAAPAAAAVPTVSPPSLKQAVTAAAPVPAAAAAAASVPAAAAASGPLAAAASGPLAAAVPKAGVAAATTLFPRVSAFTAKG